VRRPPVSRRRPVALAAVAAATALLIGPIAVRRAAEFTAARLAAAADGQALLIIVEDGLPRSEPYAWVRAEERRADAYVVLRWRRACDTLQATWIPRDLVLGEGREPLAVRFGTEGADATADAVEDAFGLDIFATLTLGLDDVRALADRIGPIEVDLAAPSRDRRTGFAAGPGTVALDAADAVAFLRSRAWEEHRAGRWVLQSGGDLARIERQQAFVAAALVALRNHPLVDTVRTGALVVRDGDVAVHDPLPVAGFLAAALQADVDLSTVAVSPERTIEERRSPFAPGQLGAMGRLVPDPAAGRAVAGAGCADSGAQP
jgi:hypothetical protein